MIPSINSRTRSVCRICNIKNKTTNTRTSLTVYHNNVFIIVLTDYCILIPWVLPRSIFELYDRYSRFPHHDIPRLNFVTQYYHIAFNHISIRRNFILLQPGIWILYEYRVLLQYSENIMKLYRFRCSSLIRFDYKYMCTIHV